MRRRDDRARHIAPACVVELDEVRIQVEHGVFGSRGGDGKSLYGAESLSLCGGGGLVAMALDVARLIGPD